MKEIRRQRCFMCRAVARECVVATDLKLPDGTPWSMFACLRHAAEMHSLSDERLGVHNGVKRIYSSGTDGYQVGCESEIIRECRDWTAARGAAKG